MFKSNFYNKIIDIDNPQTTFDKEYLFLIIIYKHALGLDLILCAWHAMQRYTHYMHFLYQFENYHTLYLMIYYTNKNCQSLPAPTL